jgi:hypothetical protein
MIDFGCLSVPFLDEYITSTNKGSYLTDIEMLCKELGMTLVGEVYWEDGSRKVQRLRHNFESLPSSFGSLAYKVIDGTDLKNEPYIRLAGCPAKLLQGHNVYGSDDIELCLFSIVEAFMLSFPELTACLDWERATVDYIDVTYSAKCENETQAQQILDVLRNIDYGQTKVSDSKFKTTVYWNKGSEHRELKCYLKFPELQRQIQELTRKWSRIKQRDLSAMSGTGLENITQIRQANNYHTDYIGFQLEQLTNPDIQQWANGRLRFEARLKSRWLVKNGVPCTLAYFTDPNNTQMLPKRLPQLWRKAFANVFGTFEGATMNANDGEKVYEALKLAYWSTTPNGNISYAKADRLHKVYLGIVNAGFKTIKATTNRKTFGRQLQELQNVGISRAQLMQFDGNGSNVVPLIRVLNFDFANQLPTEWQEPLPLSQQIKHKGLRLAS